MHVVFIAPGFPANQQSFVRALTEVGAMVTGIGEADFYSAALIALRPTQDGVIDHYEGVERIADKYSDLVIQSHLPAPGTKAQAVEAGYMANAWLQLKHPDYDELRRVLTEIGETVKVIAR